jgi:hypothetical protein
MDAQRPSGAPQVEAAAEAAADEPAAETAVTAVAAKTREDAGLDRLLAQVETPRAAPPVSYGLRSARLVSVGQGAAFIAWRGATERVAAAIAEGVEASLLEEVARAGGSVLVEDGPPPVIVGVLQTRRPRDLTLRANTIAIEAESEILLRTGRAAVRLRQDGDIEIVGGRISAASRGLFRLVGRVLRLN